MTIPTTIRWDFVPSSLGTLVEYRIEGSLVWIQPSSPANPTSNNFYTLNILVCTAYDIRLTTISSKCQVGNSITFQIPPTNCVPTTTTSSSTTTTTTIVPTTTTSTTSTSTTTSTTSSTTTTTTTLVPTTTSTTTTTTTTGAPTTTTTTSSTTTTTTTASPTTTTTTTTIAPTTTTTSSTTTTTTTQAPTTTTTTTSTTTTTTTSSTTTTTTTLTPTTTTTTTTTSTSTTTTTSSTTTTTTTASSFDGKPGSDPSGVCAGTQTTYFFTAPLASETIIYTDSGLTTPLTGFFYIGIIDNIHTGHVGTIYGINPSTGTLIADTVANCDNPALHLQDLSNEVSVSDIKIAGVTISGISFPTDAGTDQSVSVDNAGTQDLIVSWIAPSANDHITVTDTAGNVSCFTITTTSGNHTFPAQVISAPGVISIVINTGTC